VSLPTLTDLKAHLNVSTTSDDGELADMLDAAVDVVEDIVGPITSKTITETHYGLSSDVLLLRRMPVVDLLSVRSGYGAAIVDLTLADFDFDADTGIVRLSSGAWFGGNYRVTYSVGRPTVPAAVRLAILVIAGHLFETQRRPGFTSDSPAGFGGLDGVQDARPTSMGFAIPSRAKELLQPYMLTAIA
jgi:uncharacterized phiE125 gp8 family phage protein